MTMLLSTDKIQVVTSAAVTVDTHASGVDWTISNSTSAVFPPINKHITTATTTDVVDAPASGKERTLKLLTVKNIHASSSNTITVLFVAASGTVETVKCTLKPGEMLVFNERGTPFVYDANMGVKSASTDTVDAKTNDFRLSGVSATPVMSADSTTLSTLYLTQYTGNRIALFDGTNWQIIQPPSEVSVAVTGRTTDLPFDVFAVSIAGVVTLEMLNWSSATARATTLTRLDGVWTKTGDATRRYLGSVRARSATQFHWVTAGVDLPCKFDLFNTDNRIDHGFTLRGTIADYNYTTATIRQAAGSTNYQVDIMAGLQEEWFNASLLAAASNTTISIPRNAGIGYDSTSTFLTGTYVNNPNTVVTTFIYGVCNANVVHKPAIGRHFYSWNESSVATGACVWTMTRAVAGALIQAGMTGYYTC